MADGLDDVARAGFTFRANHCRAFGNAAEGFAEVAAAADEGDLEGVLFDVVGWIGGGEDFGFVDVVYAEGLKDLGGVKKISPWTRRTDWRYSCWGE